MNDILWRSKLWSHKTGGLYIRVNCTQNTLDTGMSKI